MLLCINQFDHDPSQRGSVGQLYLYIYIYIFIYSLTTTPLSVAPLATGQTVTVVQPGKSLLANTAIRVQPGLLYDFLDKSITLSSLRTVPVAKRAPEEENEVLKPCLVCFSQCHRCVQCLYFLSVYQQGQ